MDKWYSYLIRYHGKLSTYYNCSTNMTSSEFVYSLRLFNEKAEKLKRLSFTKIFFNQPTGFSLKIQKNSEGSYDLTQERTGPLEESIDAFVLTIRFFIQDNEKSSFRNLSKIYTSAPIEKKLKDEFEKIRGMLNQYLDSNSGMAIYLEDEALNHRKILNMIIYGGLSHANPDKKKKYDFLMHTPVKSMIENDFVSTLAVMFQAIKGVYDLNHIVIQKFAV